MAVAVECLVAGSAEAAAFAAVEAEVERLEQVFSRFRPDSELSRLNAAGGGRCGADLRAVLERALAARAETGGRYDPTVHDALVAAGYDRTFAALPEDGPAAGPAPCGRRVELAGERVRLEGRLDLGGIAKGYVAERACDVLRAETGAPCLVNAGGDLAVRGVPPEGVWVVAAAGRTLGLARGGLATSGRDYRRWRRGGVEQHHLIDPATGAPSRSDLLAVTAVGEDAPAAEVHAKALFLAGERAAVEEADARGIPCVLATADGRTVLAGGLA